MKFRVIVADPPWELSDKLTMSDVKRGAASNYPVLDLEAIKNLEVEKLAANDSVLALWVPSSILQVGLDTMKNWGYEHKQINVWVKTKKAPMDIPIKRFKEWQRNRMKMTMAQIKRQPELTLEDFVREFDLNEILDFNLGHLFRQTHELCLLGTRGKIYDKMKNKAQRSVHIQSAYGMAHSEKPELLQDQLDTIFGNVKKLELFARRVRKGWECVGLECPTTPGEDIRDAIPRLAIGRLFEPTDCGGSARYQGKVVPKCFGGPGCSACWLKYIQAVVPAS
jgi:N6-adenosine-specific RNA methylase IME4